MESKLRECFDEMVVYKDLKRSSFFLFFGVAVFPARLGPKEV